MSNSRMQFLAATLLMIMGTAALAADSFAPAGAKATLSVDYVYESAGKRNIEGKYGLHEWRVRRTVSLTADLAAQPTTALPTVQAISAGQTAELKGMTNKAQAVAKSVAPTMAQIEKIMAKCGEDEDCITRESMALGAAMRGTPQMDALNSAKKDMEQLSKPGAPRYQAWRPTAQKGSYSIDETAHIKNPDPICTGRPNHLCTRDEVRKGSGAIVLPPESKKSTRPGAGIAAVELDSLKNTLTLRLPIPILPLPYTETITTDEPAGTHDTPTPRGPQQKLLSFRASAEGSGTMNAKPLTVPLKGGWRSQAGEDVVTLDGKFGEQGKLTVKWRFAAQ